jgi:predicted enzyme related to lactoylglutathione lyase
MFSNALIALLAATTALAAPLNYAAAAGATVYVNAIGMGVTSKSASTSFYGKVFGVKKSASMPVPNMGQGGWNEDIDIFPGPGSSAIVIMEWTDRRPHKDLPIKLTIAVQNPQEKQALIAKSGGKALELKTEANPAAIYAADPDGYLLELIQGTGEPALKAIGVGVSNLDASATWWAGATGLTKGPVMEFKEWKSISLKAAKASELIIMEYKESPKRATKNMPIKLVFAADSTSAFTKSIQAQKPKGSSAGAMSMFQWEPIE